MKILFSTASNLKMIGGDTIQFASSASMYSKFSDVYVLTNEDKEESYTGLDFASDVNFIYKKNLTTNKEKAEEIFKLDLLYDFDYISIRGSLLAKELFNNYNDLYRNKVIVYLTDTNINVDEKIKLMEASKLVRYQTMEYKNYFKKLGYNKENTFIENPTIKKYNKSIKKEYDFIYAGKIAKGWEAHKFIELAMRYPEKTFCLVYSRILNNLDEEENLLIEYGIENLKNMDVYCGISREKTVELISKSRFGFCYRADEIDNDDSLELSTKLLEYMSTNTFPIVKNIKMYRKLLGTDYKLLLDDIEDIYFVNLENIKDDLITKVQGYYQDENYKNFVNKFDQSNKYVYKYIFDNNFTLEQKMNIYMNDIYIYGEEIKNKKYLNNKIEYKLKDSKLISKNKEINLKPFDIVSNKVILTGKDLRKISDSKINEMNLEVYSFDKVSGANHLSEDLKGITVEELDKITNTTFYFEVRSYKDLIESLDSISNIDLNLFKVKILTNIKVSTIPVRTISQLEGDFVKLNCEYKYENVNLLNIINNIEVSANRYKRSPLVIVNNIYPSNQNLYAHAFVHTRVKLYKKENINPWVIILGKFSNDVEAYYYDQQLVIKVNEIGLKEVFSDYEGLTFGIHFINTYIYQTIEKYYPKSLKTVWFHGSDCLLAEHKKDFHNLTDSIQEQEYYRRKDYMDKEFENLREVYNNPNYSYVFVSNWLKNIIAKDLKQNLQRVYVIPNSINTSHFNYKEKLIKSGEKIKLLSIMPFVREHDQYANKVLVEAVKQSTKKDWFEDVEFLIYGRGTGFNYYLDSIRKLNKNNIKINETFLTHEEIKVLHDKSHIALFPNNQDTHGVSFYEAMSSGLLSISSNNSAKPEYCKNGINGFLHKTGDVDDLVNIIENCIKNYNSLKTVRKTGSNSVKEQFGEKYITKRELEVLKVF